MQKRTKFAPVMGLALLMVVLSSGQEVIVGAAGGPAFQAVPGSGTKTFPETGKTVTGLFLDYWNSNGGLAQQGYPISDAMQEKSDL
ncbi:MAG: hypothetical protein ABIQ44_07390, partial [Chloroflexia bacterium]